MCPTCQSKSIEEHPRTAGLYVCADCGAELVRLKRTTRAGFEETYYVDASRSGVTVHTASSRKED